MSSHNINETLYGKKIDTANILNISDAKNIRDKFVSVVKTGDAFENNVIIVTGVTGQDGSYMIDYLLKNTKALIFGGVRRLSVYNHKNLSHIPKHDRFHLVNFDLTDAHSIGAIVEQLKPDYFINFAAQSFVASSWDFARQTWQTNSTSVLDILEAVRQYRPQCRFYNAGSSEEFGNVAYSPQDEQHPLRPRSPYGASKAAARQIVKVYRESYNLYAIQGWLFNHEGPRRGEEFVTRKITKGVARIAYSIKCDIPFAPIELGNVYANRDWSDSEDFVECVWLMLNQYLYRKDSEDIKKIYHGRGKLMLPQNINPTWDKVLSENIKEYVLSSNETHTIKEFVEEAFKVAGITGVWHGDGLTEEFSISTKDAIAMNAPSSVLVKINSNFYRPAEVELLMGDSTQFRNDFGWKPKTGFKQLVEKMVRSDLKDVGL